MTNVHDKEPVYSQIVKKRNEILERLGSIKYQKYRGWPRCEHMKDYDVLIFGSGDVNSSTTNEIRDQSKSITTIDNDPHYGADFSSIDDVDDESFDLIICDHVIEHIKIEECFSLFYKFFKKLRVGGGVLMTIPNIHNPGSWFSDYDHKNLAPWDNLAAFFELAGLYVEHAFYWSKLRKTRKLLEMSEQEIEISKFLKDIYGITVADYVSVFSTKSA